MDQRYEHREKNYGTVGITVVRIMEVDGWELCGIDEQAHVMYFKRPAEPPKCSCEEDAECGGDFDCDRWKTHFFDMDRLEWVSASRRAIIGDNYAKEESS